MLGTVSLILCVLFLVPPLAHAQSALQYTRDGTRTLVVKDVGADHWVIAYEPENATASGIVLDRDGGPSQFVDCSQSDATLSTLTLECFGAGSCAAAPCGGAQWSFVGSIVLDRSFLLPPNTPLPGSLPAPCPDVSGRWWMMFIGDTKGRVFSDIPLSQTGCTLVEPGILTGSLSGSVISFDFEINVAPPHQPLCPLVASGVAVTDGEAIAGTFSGSAPVCRPNQVVFGALAARRGGK